MKLDDLAGILGPAASEGIALTGITQDSRKSAPGFLFFALSGSKADGAKFAAEAAAKAQLQSWLDRMPI